MNNIQNKNSTMTGKQVIVTGSTSGIGKEIATQLAALGADLVLACRDVERGKQTADEIANRTGTKTSVVMQVDVSNQQSIHEFVRQYCERYSRLDVLINNAGIYRLQRQTRADGIELTFATNVLGYFTLTRELLDLLRASAPARVVNVASTFASNLDLNDLQFEHRSYSGQKAYSQSKACNRMLTWAFARRLEGSGVTMNAMAPGFVMTGLYRDTSLALRLVLSIVKLFFGRSVVQGADTAVWLVSSSEVQGINGRFFERRLELPCRFRNTEDEEKLWNICERLAGLIKSEKE